MSGILANSVSVTHTVAVDGENKSGYVTAERVTLSTSPTGASYAWELSIPSGSAATRSALSSTTDASPTFTPDVAGEYVIRCVVAGATTYTLRLTVVAVVVSYSVGGIRYMPTTDASVPSPSSGVTQYYSSDQGALAIKNSAGSVSADRYSHITYAVQASFTAGNSTVKPMYLNGVSNTNRVKPAGTGKLVAAEWAVYATDGSWGDAVTMSFTIINGGDTIWTAPRTITTPGASDSQLYSIASAPSVTSAMTLEPKATPSGVIGETVIATLVFTLAYPQT